MSYRIKKNLVSLKNKKLYEYLSISADDAFVNLCVGLTLDKDEKLIEDEILVGGSGDKQIDVIDILSRKGCNEVRVLQVKKIDSFKSNDVIKIGNGLQWIFENSMRDVNKLSNLKFKEKIKEVKDIWDSNVEVKVYYCTLGDENNIANEAREQKALLENKYTGIFGGRFEFNFIGAGKLYDLIIQRESIKKVVNENIKFEYIQDKGNLIDNHIQEAKGIICTVSGKEIARLVKNHGDNLFDKNIRKYLGDNKVNKAIFKTSIDTTESRFFWFFNNGITVVCDSCSVVRNPDNPHINIRNAQIVNGCQTATSLFEAEEVNQLTDNAKVLVKIFETADEKFVGRITEATNNQNTINLRDLKSNDELQIVIEEYLKEKFGYFYERKRHQYANQSNIPSENIINNEKVAQAFLAIGKKRPSVAKTSKNKLFSDDFYEDIFKNSPEQLLFSYKIADFCEGRKRKAEKGQLRYGLRIYGYLHIARMMAFYLLDSENFPPEDRLNILIKKFKKGHKLFIGPYKKAFKKLLDIVVNKVKKGEIDSLNNFFKTMDAENIVNQLLHPENRRETLR